MTELEDVLNQLNVSVEKIKLLEEQERELKEYVKKFYEKCPRCNKYYEKSFRNCIHCGYEPVQRGSIIGKSLCSCGKITLRGDPCLKCGDRGVDMKKPRFLIREKDLIEFDQCKCGEFYHKEKGCVCGAKNDLP